MLGTPGAWRPLPFSNEYVAPQIHNILSHAENIHSVPLELQFFS